MSSVRKQDGLPVAWEGHDDLDHPRIIKRFVIGAVIVALMFAFALAFREEPGADPQIRGVWADCDSSVCVSPRQLVPASDVPLMKRRLGNHALVVDIRSAAEAPGRFTTGADQRIPFMETTGASGMEFRIDFANNMDDAMRSAHMGFNEPVILTSPSVERTVLAALLLQERGYSGIRVVRDVE